VRWNCRGYRVEVGVARCIGIGRVDTDRAKEVRSCCIAGAVVDVGVVAAEPTTGVPIRIHYSVYIELRKQC